MIETIHTTRTTEEIQKIDGMVGLAMTKLSMLGNNDSEFNKINILRDDFLSGRITDIKEAEERINEVVNSKNMGF